MELKPGFKRSEAGVIPENWTVSRLSEHARKITDGEHLTPKRTSSGYYLLSARNILNGHLDLEDVDYVGASEYRRIRQRCNPEAGDVLISCSGTVGRVATVPAGLECVMVRSAALVKPDVKNLSGLYVQYFLQSKQGQDQILASLNQGAQANLFLNHIQGLRIPLPPTPIEQEGIAEVLSDADALIESLEQLISKKRHLKQGAMQELLTGKKRLPGFNGEWSPGSLSSVIASLEAGVSVNSVDADSSESSNEECVLKTSAVSNGRFLPHECKPIAPRDLNRAKLSPRRDTIIISRMNTPDLVGECGYIEQDYPHLFVPDRLWMTRFVPGSGIYPRWLSLLLSGAEYKQRIRAAATGTSGSMKNLAKDAFLSLQVHFPEFDEQAAIAAILSDLDAEITAMEARRTKARQVKQGMMQELLTGKIRLV